VGVLFPPPFYLRTEPDPVSETSCFLVSRIPDDGKVQKKNSNPVYDYSFILSGKRLCQIDHLLNVNSRHRISLTMRVNVPGLSVHAMIMKQHTYIHSSQVNTELNGILPTNKESFDIRNFCQNIKQHYNNTFMDIVHCLMYI
jgi:hypothetical protein